MKLLDKADSERGLAAEGAVETSTTAGLAAPTPVTRVPLRWPARASADWRF